MRQVETYQCALCGKTFSDQAQFDRHAQQEHDMAGGSRTGSPTMAGRTPQGAVRAVSYNVAAPPPTAADRALEIVITLLALADGALHYALDYVLFHGRIWGTLPPARPPAGAPHPGGGPPPGAGPGLPAPHIGPPPTNPILHALDIRTFTGLPLNELFLLNFIGYIVLAGIFWFGRRWLGAWRWLIDVAIIVYAVLSIIGWLDAHGPNPQGLGYISKGLEIALIVALLAHIAVIIANRGRASTRPPAATKV